MATARATSKSKKPVTALTLNSTAGQLNVPTLTGVN